MMRTEQIKVPANGYQQLQGEGLWFKVRQMVGGSTLTANVESVTGSKRLAENLVILSGDLFQFTDPFRKVVFYNSSGVDITCAVTVSDQASQVSESERVFVENFPPAAVITTSVANTFTPVVDATINAGVSGTLAAADITRYALWVTIPLVDTTGALIVSNTGCRIGDSTVDATRGMELFPGDTVRIPGTARVDLFNNTGVNIKPHVLAERFV